MTQAMQFLALPWTWAIQYDAADDCWIATVAELPDFFAAGSTPGDAAGNGREALLSHLSGYIASGTPIPTPHPQARQQVTTGRGIESEVTDVLEVAA